MEYANYSGLPLALVTMFHENEADRALFEALPEQAQQQLLQESIQTPRDLHECLHRLEQKR